MKQWGCGIERVGVSQWQVTNLSALLSMGAPQPDAGFDWHLR
jgi:hypothetical protein